MPFGDGMVSPDSGSYAMHWVMEADAEARYGGWGDIKPVPTSECPGFNLRLVWGEWDDHGVRATCTRCSFATGPYLSADEAKERGSILHDQARGEV